MSSADDVLRRADADGVTTLTLHRPDQYNTLSEALLEQLQAALDALARDPGARVVVLAGAGRAFCAGHDLREMRAHPSQDYYERLFARCSQLMLTLTRLPQPVIARVHGVAAAAGCQLVASCDLAVAADSARFATSGINVGLFCATPAVPLVRNVARKRAFEMLFTGELIDAATARDWGLVNQVAPAEKLDAAVVELARRIVAKPAAVVAQGKAAFYRQLELGPEAAYAHASAEMARGMMSPDADEGIEAFLDKRPPAWAPRA
jgi:enoyl-CoA hydratase/carnithine racemase